MTAGFESRKGFLVCISGPSRAIDAETGTAFANSAECIRILNLVSDVVELAFTNSRAARSEWSNAGLPPCNVVPTRRREMSVCLSELMSRGYAGRATLMIGCGAHDRDAAISLGAFFYAILPGQEAACWRELQEEALPKFLHGTFNETYQKMLIARHDSVIKET